MDLNIIKSTLLPVLAPQLCKTVLPIARDKIKEVCPLDDATEDLILKALEDAIIASAEKSLDIDLDGDGKVGSVTFND